MNVRPFARSRLVGLHVALGLCPFAEQNVALGLCPFAEQI